MRYVRVRSIVSVFALAMLAACYEGNGPTTPSGQSGTSTPTPTPTAPVAGTLNVVLGRPTGSSIAMNVMAEPGTQVSVDYGRATGTYGASSTVETVGSGGTAVVELAGLAANTRYYYRARYRPPSETTLRTEPERSFMTQRTPGAAFTFGVQGDSHPERAGNMFNADLYVANMRNVAASGHDFYLALGDDFSSEPLFDRNALSQDAVNQIYATQRAWFAVPGHSTPVFLVNGNHEQAAAYLLNGRFPTPFALAPVYQLRARTSYFALPSTDGFYDADLEQLAGVGPLRDYYAWTWGDALFVTLDPYWHSPVPVDNGAPGVEKTRDQWESTIGDAQYAWLKRVLETSRARYKFVFEHHVLGTGRGAAGLVHSFEWGGYNRAGTAYEFSSMRPTWAKPLHQLFNDTGVTIVFSAHDHVFARETVDRVVYQSVPNPADNTYTAFNADAYLPARVLLPGAKYVASDGVVQPNAGHLSVAVASQQVTVSYVRAVLPGDEAKAGAANGSVSVRYSVSPAGVVTQGVAQ